MTADTFVLYEGDDPIATGTAEEIEAMTGITARMVRYYSYPSAQARATKEGAIRKLLSVRVKAEELA